MKNIALLKANGIDLESAVQILGSMEFYDETLQTFLQGIAARLTKIKQYKETNDMANYAIEVHGLKSDSKYLGFTKLAEMSYQHEMASKQNDIVFVNAHFNEYMMEAVRIVTVARQYNGQSSDTTTSKPALIVADDSNIIRGFICKLLSNDYEILQAIDGNQVIKIIEDNKDKNIVGLLLDLNMPNANGFAVLDYYKQNNLFNTIPVSLITGDDSKDSIDKAFQYPIVDMLNKPFNENNLRSIVEKTVSYKQ